VVVEAKKIKELLDISANIDMLNAEMGSLIDMSNMPYRVVYVPDEHFVLDSNMKYIKHEPETHYMLDNNPESKQLKMPTNGFTITTMLRGKKEQTIQYLNIIGQIGTKVLFIRPFIEGNNLKIFNPSPNGGWHIRVALLKDTDYRRIGFNS
jgi:hypothetical protein